MRACNYIYARGANKRENRARSPAGDKNAHEKEVAELSFRRARRRLTSVYGRALAFKLLLYMYQMRKRVYIHPPPPPSEILFAGMQKNDSDLQQQQQQRGIKQDQSAGALENYTLRTD